VVAIGREGRDTMALTMPLLNLGFSRLMLGDAARAREHFRESLTLCREVGDWRTLHFNLIALATLANTERRGADAARLLGATAAVSARTGIPIQPPERHYHDLAVAAARAALGDAAYDAAYVVGRGWAVDEAIARALDQCLPSAS
jgi:hypothetical protein